MNQVSMMHETSLWDVQTRGEYYRPRDEWGNVNYVILRCEAVKNAIADDLDTTYAATLHENLTNYGF